MSAVPVESIEREVPSVDPAPGFLRSLRREHGFEPLRVEGTVPDGLRGTLYRNGPGLFELHGRAYDHPFEGDGAVVAVRFGEGGVAGAHRVVRSAGLEAEHAAGRPLYGSIAPWTRRVSNALRGRMKNAANTSVMLHQDRLLALFEAGKPTQIDADSLETIGETDLGGVVPAAFSAHPRVVPERRATYNFGLRYGAKTQLDLFELPFQGDARVLTSVPLEDPVLLHDFVATTRHLVFLVSPVTIVVHRALLGLRPFEKLFAWRPSKGTEVIVVPIDDCASVTRFRVDASFQWHFVGAIERGDELLLDLVRYDDLDSFEAIAKGARVFGRVVRTVIEPRTKTARTTPVADVPCELPVIDPRFVGAHRTCFVAAFEPSGVAAIDVETGRTRRLALPTHQIASEPVFVPRAPDAPEGDGWLLVLVYDGREDRSHVAVVDATRIEDGPIARAWFDHHVPMTFHGVFDPTRDGGRGSGVRPRATSPRA